MLHVAWQRCRGAFLNLLNAGSHESCSDCPGFLIPMLLLFCPAVAGRCHVGDEGSGPQARAGHLTSQVVNQSETLETFPGASDSVAVCLLRPNSRRASRRSKWHVLSNLDVSQTARMCQKRASRKGRWPIWEPDTTLPDWSCGSRGPHVAGLLRGSSNLWQVTSRVAQTTATSFQACTDCCGVISSETARGESVADNIV